jgi:hypothetical protein
VWCEVCEGLGSSGPHDCRWKAGPVVEDSLYQEQL